MKRNNIRIISAISLIIIALTVIFNLGIHAFADDNGVISEPEKSPTNLNGNNTEAETDGGDISQNIEDNPTESGENDALSGELPNENEENHQESGDYEQNLFEELYAVIELNADKIFSILAFIGTLIVGVGYKSGLLPLLRDALTKLKGAIDGVKADGEQTKLQTEEKLSEISSALDEVGEALQKMKWQYESYDEICREHESMRLILQGQIDMLYSIFMTSALPQYQKDEVGERISQMREELKNYESSERN